MMEKEKITFEEGTVGVLKRKGIKFMFAETDEDKKVVSMLEFQGFVYVATQKGIYRIEGDDVVRLQFVEKTE